MRVLNFLMAALYIVFAFLSINSTNPVLWIMIYGCVAVMAILAMYNIYNKPVLMVLFLLMLIFSFYLLDGFMHWVDHLDFRILFDFGNNTVAPEYLSDTRHYLSLKLSELIIAFYYILSLLKKSI